MSTNRVTLGYATPRRERQPDHYVAKWCLSSGLNGQAQGCARYNWRKPKLALHSRFDYLSRPATTARVVNTASEVHRGAQLDFDDLQSEHAYNSYEAYGRSKLANLLFTRELARRFLGSGLTANSLHPGIVASRLGQPRAGVGGDSSVVSFLASGGLSPEEGAETIVYLASSPDAAQLTGEYFSQCRAIQPSKEAQDQVAGEKLWEESERLAGVEFRNGRG